MKIGAVQYKPIAGDKSANIRRHADFIERAIKEGVDLIYFPELSITGYEPKVAKLLVTDQSDIEFDVFQRLSDIHGIIIGIGVPISASDYIQIGMIWFQPNSPRTSYAKQLLYSNEKPFFISGDKQLLLYSGDYRIAPAICYESLQSSHSDNAVTMGANIYLASVAKSARGIEKAMQHYPEIANKYSMYVVMANCIGPSDDFISVGSSSAWGKNGELLNQLQGEWEGLLIVDVENNNAVAINL